MYKILITLLTITMITYISAAEDSTRVNRIVKEYELGDEQRKAWNSIKDSWMKNSYRACIKKFSLKMSCAGCVYIYMNTEISINSKGRLENYKIKKANICGRDKLTELEKCFIEPLQHTVFPNELKNTEFEAMLGTGLKC